MNFEPILATTKNRDIGYNQYDCKLRECVRWGGGLRWWVVRGSGKGVQNLMGLQY